MRKKSKKRKKRKGFAWELPFLGTLRWICFYIGKINAIVEGLYFYLIKCVKKREL